MLCQTQVARVIDYYKKRLEILPSVESLAKASNEVVLRAWSGLWYNSRALRLKQAALHIVGQKAKTADKSYFPSTYSDLISLPGVGDYISNAILAFAYNQNVVVVDTNIRRIMIHEFCRNDTAVQLDQIKVLVQQTLVRGKARDWYNALMDYGALELTAKKAGIRSLTKQSKFEGSTRQVRAGILKAILSTQWCILTKKEIENIYSEREDLDQIISKMISDRLIIETTLGFTIFH